MWERGSQGSFHVNPHRGGQAGSGHFPGLCSTGGKFPGAIRSGSKPLLILGSRRAGGGAPLSLCGEPEPDEGILR